MDGSVRWLMGLKPLPRPFEVDADYLQDHLDEMVDAVFADLQSQFLVLPKGPHFVEYPRFQDAYEVLKRETGSFGNIDENTLWAGLREDALTFLVLRTILGLSPPEWADLARSDIGVDVPQGAARTIDVRCRKKADYFSRLTHRRNEITMSRVSALLSVAASYLTRDTGLTAGGTVHRLDKVDTSRGRVSLQHVAAQHVPYSMLLYERYLGRPFASHRDSVSELVGDVMESAIEDRLVQTRITFRRTRRAERIPDFEQSPDFFIPDEFNPAVIIEAKVSGDDGTTRDKVTRIEKLATIRDERVRAGQAGFEVVACIDGRGFGVRREDMRRMILRTRGKIFTLATLDQLIPNTRLREFTPKE